MSSVEGFEVEIDRAETKSMLGSFNLTSRARRKKMGVGRVKMVLAFLLRCTGGTS